MNLPRLNLEEQLNFATAQLSLARADGEAAEKRAKQLEQSLENEALRRQEAEAEAGLLRSD